MNQAIVEWWEVTPDGIRGQIAHRTIAEHFEAMRRKEKAPNIERRYVRKVGDREYVRVLRCEPEARLDMPDEAIALTIGFNIGPLSKNQHTHPRVRAKRVRACRLVTRFTWELAGRPKSAVPVRVHYVVRRARALDLFNLHSAMDAIIDGLFVKAITPDDNAKWVHPGNILSQETAPEWLFEEEVEVWAVPLS